MPRSKKLILLKLTSLSLACSLLFSEVQAQCTLSFSGKVYDEDTREVLQDALVTIVEKSMSVKSDAKGLFLIKGLCPGIYDIEISHVGCVTQKLHLHIKEDLSKDFYLPHTANELSEVVVIGSGNVQSTGFTNQVKGRDLDIAKGNSLAESMRSVAGVSMLQTGSNIYKPVIHGLHSNRIIILNNGIRQEGQQWGSEHAPEIDPFIANRITVIKGAGSLRYGSDAIGGVVLVEPRLLPARPGISGEINIAAFSNNRQGVISGIAEGNSEKHPAFAWRVQGTIKRGGNARTPEYWLANSGASEYNFSAAAGWRKANKGIELFASQFNTRLGIFAGSHIGNVTDLQEAINNGQPPEYIRNVGFTYKIGRPYQEVQHTLGKIKAFKNTGEIGRLNVVVSAQHNERQEFDQLRFANSNSAPQLDMDLVTLATDVVWDHFSGSRWRGTVGVNGAYQRNLYFSRFFIPNYEALNTGVFIIEKYTTQKWLFEGGIRFDNRSIFNTDRNNGFSYADKNFNSISANGGLTYRMNDRWQALVSLSSAWRAPQVNELYSDGLHHGAARIETGNDNLLAERANSLMAGINHQGERLTIEAGYFFKFINNFIYLRPTFPPQLTIRGAFPAFEYAQTDARLSGLDLSLKYKIDDHFSYNGKAALLRARDRIAGDWLVQMPADRFENQLEYQWSDTRRLKQNFLRITLQSVLEQTRIPATGNIEITKPDGTISLEADYSQPPPAYHLMGLEGGTTIVWGKQPLQFIVGVANLFNIAYRDYLNAFRYFSDEMGRNLFIKIKIPFQPLKKTS